jgi:hypothetical protein
LTKIGADKVRDFKVKLDNKHIKTGIFIAPNGVTGSTGSNKLYGANGQIDKFLQEGVKIIILEDDDICEILDCKDVYDKIDEKFIELYKS